MARITNGETRMPDVRWLSGERSMSKRIMLGTPCFREGPELLRDAINSFLDPLVDVVVVDNGSSAECKDVLEEFAGKIEVIRNPENVYVNPAWNQIAARFLESDTEILVIANADAVLSPGWGAALKYASFHVGRFWFGRGVAHRALLDVQLPPVLASVPPPYGPGHSAGTLFALTRDQVEACFPIPSELRIYHGDNWIFELLMQLGHRGVIVEGLRVWHAESVSSKHVPEIATIAAAERAVWDSYVGYMCRRSAEAIARGDKLDALERKYIQLRDTPSDINEHLPTLRSYASQCRNVTEFGVGRSSWALAQARPKVLRCYDPRPDPNRCFGDDLLKMAKEAGIIMSFTQANDLEIRIDPTDMLFIDTLHTCSQLSQELEMHAPNVVGYILMHDTEIFGMRGEDGSEPGLIGAVDRFLAKHQEWRETDRYRNNNGLMILERA